jgi:hypothetical protein
VAAEAARAAAAAAAAEQAAIAFWQVFTGSSEELRQARASKKYPSVADKRESQFKKRPGSFLDPIHQWKVSLALSIPEQRPEHPFRFFGGALCAQREGIDRPKQ